MLKLSKIKIFAIIGIVILINYIGFLFNNSSEISLDTKNNPVETIINTIQNNTNINTNNTDTTSSTPKYQSGYKFDRSKLDDTKLYKVISVSDGDTIKIDNDGKKITVRMIGVDTPETVDPRKPVQCFGKEASNFTKSVLKDSKVYLVSDPTQQSVDKYGRWLRYVVLEDMTFFNYELIYQGYAHEYTYGQIPYIYQKEFKDAEKNARENNRGLWSPETCNGDTTKKAK